MIDSTYTVACDPNTMRDTGPVRNARYVINDPVEENIKMKQSQSTNFNPTNTFMTFTPEKVHDIRS